LPLATVGKKAGYMKNEDAEKKPAKPKPKVHKELQGFDVSIDSFGEIKSNMDIEKINVDDKKLAERNDYDEMKKGKKKK
jgi:hypothetical protein